MEKKKSKMLKLMAWMSSSNFKFETWWFEIFPKAKPITRRKLLHLYLNMTHTHESKCTIWTTPHTKICDMQPNDIEINGKNTAFMRQISKQNAI